MSRSSPKPAQTTSPSVVRPVSVSEKSALESVVDFFTDVVPQTASCEKEQILWVKFEVLSPLPCEERKTPITLVVIGYANGAQIWQLHTNGDAQELISIRQGPMKVYTLIQRCKDSETPTPEYLIASSDETKHSQAQFLSLRLTSIMTGEIVWRKTFKSMINDVHTNSKLLLITFHQKIAAFNLKTLEQAFTITGCFPTDGINQNPVSLSTSWLAYANSKLVTHVQSGGQSNTEAALSYTAAALNTAKNVAKGFTSLSETLLGNFTTPPKSKSRSSSFAADQSGESSPHSTSGVVTVVNCDKICYKNFELKDADFSSNEVVCHFQALPHRVAHLKFDPTGTLLFCACREGQNFHIYRLLADVCNSKQASIQHLYVLHRGDTTAQVLDVTFSLDSRWVGVCTARGTTHVFPISPYGGPCTARTHTNQFVVNKSSRYQKSAGLDDSGQLFSHMLPTFTSDSIQSMHMKFNNGALENPRVTSFTDTHVQEPVVQIKQPIWLTQQTRHKYIPNKNIAAIFTATKGKTRKHSHGLRTMSARESLYVISDNGSLVEYLLQPCCDCEPDKVTDDTELRLSVTARSRWPLTRSHSNKELNKLNSNHYLSSSPGSEKSCTRYGSKESISSDTGSVKSTEFDQPWLSQVEIVTYSGPNRRLWMGPQFKFKTFNSNSVVVSSNSPALFPSITPEIPATSDIICDATDLESLQINNTQSQPITMPARDRRRQLSGEIGLRNRHASVDEIFIEAGSFDPSPFADKDLDAFEDAAQFPASESLILLEDAMIDQRMSSESLSSGDLMSFPPGS